MNGKKAKKLRAAAKEFAWSHPAQKNDGKHKNMHVVGSKRRIYQDLKAKGKSE